MPVAQIAETLTLLGSIEVDGIEHEHPPFAKVVVGEILSVKPHPNAEKLQIAEVSDGKKTYQIVCGASNCRAGMKSAFAPVGAVLTDGKGSFEIKEAKLRGVESQGMLCSATELRLSEEGDGIMDLPAEFKTGSDLTPLLWDPVFELSLTPNLGYCLSAKGVAQELSAALNIPLLKRAERKVQEEGKPQEFKVGVHDPKLCPRYMGRSVDGVKIGPSPFWLQSVLQACGMRPINNAVDIANYIMVKWGQPMHAFDADLLEGKTIEVVSSKHAEKFACLDDIEREAPPAL